MVSWPFLAGPRPSASIDASDDPDIGDPFSPVDLDHPPECPSVFDSGGFPDQKRASVTELDVHLEFGYPSLRLAGQRHEVKGRTVNFGCPVMVLHENLPANGTPSHAHARDNRRIFPARGFAVPGRMQNHVIMEQNSIRLM